MVLHTLSPLRPRMSSLEQMCHKIDDDQCTGGHFLNVFREKLAVCGIFTPENLARFEKDTWGAKFGLKEGQIMVLDEYILCTQNTD